jgi:hypothetical protein
VLVMLMLCAALVPAVSQARVGGGQSYSGSRSSSSSSRSSSSSGSSWGSSRSSSGSSWGSSSSSRSYGYSSGSSSYSRNYDAPSIPFFGLLLIIGVVAVMIVVLNNARGSTQPVFESNVVSEPRPRQVAVVTPAEKLRTADPSFSEAAFLEWATLLFMRGQKSRGGSAEVLSPWFDDVAESLPKTIDGRPVGEVLGVVVGSARMIDAWADDDQHTLQVAFRACLTTRAAVKDQAWYLEETWSFRRKAGARSRSVDDLEKVACPSCSAPFERDPMGTCLSCSQPLTPGERDWTVALVQRGPVETRPPLLTGNVEEQGTRAPSVRSRTLASDKARFASAFLGFSWAGFEAEAKDIFLALQKAWSDGQWEALRPLETECVFQSHRFWMDEYKKQGLRNVLADVTLSRVEVVKVTRDQAYDSVTCRMHASMRDSTVRVSDGKVVGGNPRQLRPFTEYWTFVRRPGAQRKAGDSLQQCPNCGAGIKVSQAGICEYCEAKVTNGQFGWLLSRIDQDEEYEG